MQEIREGGDGWHNRWDSNELVPSNTIINHISGWARVSI